MNRETPTEYEEQVSFVQYLKLKNIFHFAVVNENQQSKLNKRMAISIALKQKKSGKKAGVSDIIVMLEDKILFIEMKRRPKILKSGKESVSHTSISKDQKIFLESVGKFKYAESTVLMERNRR